MMCVCARARVCVCKRKREKACKRFWYMVVWASVSAHFHWCWLKHWTLSTSFLDDTARVSTLSDWGLDVDVHFCTGNSHPPNLQQQYQPLGKVTCLYACVCVCISLCLCRKCIYIWTEFFLLTAGCYNVLNKYYGQNSWLVLRFHGPVNSYTGPHQGESHVSKSSVSGS